MTLICHIWLHPHLSLGSPDSNCSPAEMSTEQTSICTVALLKCKCCGTYLWWYDTYAIPWVAHISNNSSTVKHFSALLSKTIDEEIWTVNWCVNNYTVLKVSFLTFNTSCWAGPLNKHEHCVCLLQCSIVKRHIPLNATEEVLVSAAVFAYCGYTCFLVRL